MGSGKSRVGKALAEQMKIPFLDLDAYIETEENRSIPAIFNAVGELGFRKLEWSYLQQLVAQKENQVLALGGGTPCYSNVMGFLKSQPQIRTVFLKTQLAILAERLWSERRHRPMIAHIESQEALVEFIGKHLFERNPFYEQALYRVDTSAKSVSTIVAELESLLG